MVAAFSVGGVRRRGAQGWWRVMRMECAEPGLSETSFPDNAMGLCLCLVM